MTDEEFESRQQALERAAAAESTAIPVFETLDLLIFRKVDK